MHEMIVLSLFIVIEEPEVLPSEVLRMRAMPFHEKTSSKAFHQVLGYVLGHFSFIAASKIPGASRLIEM